MKLLLISLMLIVGCAKKLEPTPGVVVTQPIAESDVVIPNFDYLASPGQIVEIRRESGEVLVATGKNFLVMKVIEYENSGLVKPTEVIKSIRTRLGLNVELEILRILNIIPHNGS